MTPELWKRVEELYHRARARPREEHAAFLAEACPDDEDLRREVESLLEKSGPAERFLSKAPIVMPAYAVSDLVHPPMTGRSIGGYHLQALLGAGGMGEVYRSHDTKLGRDVAIKILPRAFANEPDRLARFEREARVLATLNHPNIYSIYGLEEAEGIRFLVLELVEGETLAETLAHVSPGTGLPVRDAVSIARQVAEALEVAHEKGIIHRDLKPANIKVTPDGVVKVLDFGLAKAAVGDGSMPGLTQLGVATADGRREGVVMGTAAYMSPEQARGQAVDKRTDIWAFGCVLYEMLTGRPPFAGETVSDTIAKILEREADWAVLPAATPSHIRRLLLRCLAKDPKQRLRDIGDFRIEIDATQEALPRDSETTPQPGSVYTKWLPWVAFVAFAASVGVWEARRPEDPLANAKYTRFTDWEGAEMGAEISPDGKFVAFVADRDGEFDLWLSQVGTGRFQNLTPDISSLNPPGVVLRSLGFSGDGTEIWFSLSGNPGDRKVRMPLTGGSPRAFLGEGAAAPSWSPDGSRLAYFNNRDGDPLFVADGTGADAHQIFAGRKGFHNHNPVWSLDGQWIYFVHGLDPTGKMEVMRVRPSGESPEQLTEQNAVNFIAPLDKRTLLYVARGEDRSGPWLWALDVASNVKRRLISGLEQYTSVAASADGRHVVATVANPTASLWSVPLLSDRLAEDRDFQPYPPATVRALAPRFGGTSLFYLSASGTGDGLWRIQDGQASEVWKDGNSTLSEPVAVSPDGSRLAVVIGRQGKRHLVIMSPDGTNSRTLATSVEIQGAAGQCSADWLLGGTGLVVGGSDVQGPGLFKIPVDGGSPVRLVVGQATNPVRSPDGNLIVYAGAFVGGRAPLLGIRPNGTPVELPRVGVRPGGYRFLPDGTGLAYLPRIQAPDFWLLDFATKASRQITHFSNQGQIATFDIMPDGKQIVFDRSRQNSDIVLIDLPK
jgi:serine/threonine protein kinase/Tol biopolymer transport system component